METITFPVLDDGTQFPDAPNTVTIGTLNIRADRIDALEKSGDVVRLYALGRVWTVAADYDYAVKMWEELISGE